MCGLTRKYKIRNEHIRGTTRVAQASKKSTERRLIWYGHVMRRDGEHIIRKVLRADIPGKRKRGRPKTRWKDACQRDLKNTGLRTGEETDMATWRRKIISHQRHSQDFFLGGPPCTFSSPSPGADRIQWGGGSSKKMSR